MDRGQYNSNRSNNSNWTGVYIRSDKTWVNIILIGPGSILLFLDRGQYNSNRGQYKSNWTGANRILINRGPISSKDQLRVYSIVNYKNVVYV